MNQYESSISEHCRRFSEVLYVYDEKLPEDFIIPSLYFPAAETLPSKSTLGSYKSEYAIYAKLFASSDREAMERAERIVQGIMKCGCRLPVLTSSGVDTGTIVRLEPPAIRPSDDRVAQITLIYRVERLYKREKQNAMQRLDINKNYD